MKSWKFGDLKEKTVLKKIKKYQFKTKEEADAFVQASPFHTQVYKMVLLILLFHRLTIQKK